ncbi:MAG: VCBS repeat-containing protein [Phycisphaerales bacterium]
MPATTRTASILAACGLAAACAPALAQTFPAELHVEDLDGGNGFAVDGVPAAPGLGRSVSNAGDVNGDGVDDFIVARANGAGLGATYVVFGDAGGFPAVIDVEDLDGANGFRIDGFEPADVEGRSVARAGDVNGDGVDDIIIGNARAAGGDGRASVVFGRAMGSGGFPAVVDLADLDGGDGFTLLGEAGFGYGVGNAVAGAGDVNGDGIDDVIVGSDDYYGAWRDSGRAHVIFGRTTGFDATIPIGAAGGFAVIGEGYRAHLGRSVAAAGDINGDGLGDVIIGSTDWGGHPYYSVERAGAAYVIYGRAGTPSGTISIARLSGLGFEIRGQFDFENFGEAVASAGDLNGDGVDDVIIGVRDAFRVGNSGAAWVIYGRGPGEPSFPELLLTEGLAASDGARFDGQFSGDQTGRSVAPLGDINGDGLDDVAIGAWGWGATYPSEFGAAYVVYGRSDDFPSRVLLEDLGGEAGFRIRGENPSDELGWSVSSAGDVNGDGARDILVGAPGAIESGGIGAGRAYVIYGQSGACPADVDGDGELTLFDFLAFQNLFDAGDPRADFDADGSLTLFDFLAFQNAFDAGCP